MGCPSEVLRASSDGCAPRSLRDDRPFERADIIVAARLGHEALARLEKAFRKFLQSRIVVGSEGFADRSRVRVEVLGTAIIRSPDQTSVPELHFHDHRSGGMRVGVVNADGVHQFTHFVDTVPRHDSSIGWGTRESNQIYRS